MTKWFRVFGASDTTVEPAALVELLRGSGWEISTARFRGDEQGWFALEVLFEGAEAPWRLDRYLSTEEGIRAELNTWAAWVETVEGNPHQARLMQQLITAKQVFTFEIDVGDLDDAGLEKWCHDLCQFLARETAGVYQADGRGFFAADGTLLLAEGGAEKTGPR